MLPAAMQEDAKQVLTDTGSSTKWHAESLTLQDSSCYQRGHIVVMKHVRLSMRGSTAMTALHASQNLTVT